MAAHAQAVRIEAATGSAPREQWGEWNDWLDQTRSREKLNRDETRQAQEKTLLILEATDEPILRHKALRLCAVLGAESLDLSTREKLRALVRPILSSKATIWEQVGALLVFWMLEQAAVAASQLVTTLDRSRDLEDGFFLRANLLEHAKTDRAFFLFLKPLLARFIHDSSAYVRIRALELLAVRGEYALLLERCEAGESDPQVQAPLLHCCADLFLALDEEDLIRATQAFQQVHDTSSLAARCAFVLNLNENLLNTLREGRQPSLAQAETLRTILTLLRRDEEDLLRRSSSLTRQCLQILFDVGQREKFLKWQTALAGPGSFEKIRRKLEDSFDEDAQLLTVLAFFGLGYEVKLKRSQVEIRAAYGTSFSLWRFLHELKRPSGNKRQGAAHWKSRHLQGQMRIPSSLTCELVATTVPGEPLFIAEAGGWRPWLPLLCDVYRMIFRFPILKIFTPDGLTRVERPRTWPMRLRAWMHLLWNYERVSRLRNWTSRHGGDPAAYIQQLRELGFAIRFEPALAQERDGTILKFFGRES